MLKKWITLILTLFRSGRDNQKEKKEMKTLIALSATWLAQTGNPVGFFMKSLKTKKVFQVISKTPSGSKFVIVLTRDARGNVVTNGEEYVVSGNKARYEMYTANGGRIAELEAQIAKLETQRDNLDNEIATLEDQLADLEDEVG